jgi:signal transduction histidine kinase
MVIERQMQEEKQKKQERDKLAAIGQLAAGIAHEVRNPLTTIKGFVQLLNKHGDKRNVEMTSCYLELIDKEIDRMNDLLKDFLLFAKPVKPKLAVTNINQTIKDIDTLLNNHCFNHSTKMELILNPEMPNIFCDYDQIKQVIINVVFNSIDAMKDCDRKIIRIMTKYKHDYIYINIEDTGVGMTEEQSRKIFDPFYTTKENGTGLGLSICYSIIENHQGKINVTSIINKGTIFEISLPRYN